MLTKGTLARCAIFAIIGAALGSCAFQRAQKASDAQETMVGLSKEQVLVCMGAPENAAEVGKTEVWTYNSGNGRTDTFSNVHAWGGNGYATGIGSNTSSSRSCKVNVVMMSGRVAHVNYSGPTGGVLTKGEQCAYAVENCIHQTSAFATTSASQPPATQTQPTPALAQTGQIQVAHVCTKEEKKLAQFAVASGWQGHSNCN